MNKEFFKAKSYEMSKKKDYLQLTYILVTADVPNFNGALFTKAELERSKKTVIGQPLIVLPDDINMPTGHDVSNFPQLSPEAVIVGTHTDAWLGEHDGKTHLFAKANVWAVRYPELASSFLRLHQDGDLKFSMECSYERWNEVAGARELLDVHFLGSCAVVDPANPFSISLEVANKKGGKFTMTLEQALEKIGTLQGTISNLENDIKAKDATIETLQGDKGTLETDKQGLQESVETMTASLEKANEELDALKNEIAEKAKKELAQKRFDQMAEHIEYPEKEVEEKKLAFASMSEDTFKILLDTAKASSPKRTETAGTVSDTKLNLEDNLLEGLMPKE